MTGSGPSDIAPSPPPTAERYLRLNALVDTAVTVIVPGEVVEDAEGTPTAASSPSVVEATLLGAYVTLHELAAVGLTPEDVPNLRVFDVSTEKENSHD